MKTVADLKRDLRIGTKVVLTGSNGKIKNKGVERFIVKVNTTGIYLNADKNAKTGSFLGYPIASLAEYTGDTLKIYEQGYRQLTETEKKLFDNMPSRRAENADRCATDLQTDGSYMYYKDKAYTKDNDIEWYWHETRGLYYDDNTKTMRDSKIKGELSLEYKIN